MLLGSHPSLNCKRSRILVALIIRDVFTEHGKGKNAGHARTIAQMQTIRRVVRKVIEARHALRVRAGHAADVCVPDERRQTMLNASEVGLLESAALDVTGFSKSGRGARGDRSAGCRSKTRDEASDRLRFGLLAQSSVAAKQAGEQKQEYSGHPKHAFRVSTLFNYGQPLYSIAGSARLSAKRYTIFNQEDLVG